MAKPLAQQLTFDKDTMWVRLVDRHVLEVPLAFFPRLLHGSPQLLRQYVISGGGTGIHWDALDEDISVEHLVLGRGDCTHQPARRG